MDDKYNITVVSSEEPITKEEAKAFIKDVPDVEDAIIDALIVTARKKAESFTNRVFIKRTYEGFFAQLQQSQYELHPYIEIRRAPLNAITSVEISISDSFEANTDFQIKDQSSFPRLVWPDTSALTDADDIPYPMKVTFIAGYENAAAVPEDIKTALKMYVAFFYENRGDVEPEAKKGMPVAVRALLNSYKIINSFG